MENFWKEFKEGFGHVLACTLVEILFVDVLYYFTQITKCSGWGSVLIFVVCSILLLFVVMLFLVIGSEQLEYKELSEKRDREIKEKLNLHEKEMELCVTSHTES